MKRKILLLFIISLSLQVYSQINFEKGYFIKNNGEQINCLIKNIDWKNNPKSFKYKLKEDSPVKDIDITDVKELSVISQVKYKRFIVKIDYSSEEIHSMDKTRNPKWKEETLFLKVLVEGKANLYSYEKGNLKRYFFSKKDITPQQLVHRYYLSSNGDKSTNNDYKYQLKSFVYCSSMEPNVLKNISYKENSLTNYFISYNRCNDTNYINVNTKKSNNLFHLKIKAGANFSSLAIKNLVTTTRLRDFDFGNKTSLRFGLEAEYVFPFNKNKWSLFIEPSYQSFSALKEKDIDFTLTITTHQTADVNYKSVEVPVGFRHYIFLNEKSALFVDAAYIFDFDFNSAINFEVGNDLEIESDNFFALGAGYSYNNKFNIEFRYNSKRSMLISEAWSSNYNSAAVILGYTLF